MAAPSLNLDPERERRELEAYLGDRFRLDLLQRYDHTLDEEFAQMGDEDAFYRSSEGYLYNLTAFAMTGTKLPYLERLVRLVPAGARLLDYGCGIGSDGLALLEAGYRVEFADFDNPSVEYLRWRLRRRDHEAPIHDLDRDVPAGFDLAYAFDVIEHVRDPFAFLGALESRAATVLVNLLAPTHFEPAYHRELPLDALLAHVSSRRLRFYGIYHGRSHLLAYSPPPAGPVRGSLGRARIAATRARARLAARLSRSPDHNHM